MRSCDRQVALKVVGAATTVVPQAVAVVAIAAEDCPQESHAVLTVSEAATAVAVAVTAVLLEAVVVAVGALVVVERFRFPDVRERVWSRAKVWTSSRFSCTANTPKQLDLTSKFPSCHLLVLLPIPSPLLLQIQLRFGDRYQALKILICTTDDVMIMCS